MLMAWLGKPKKPEDSSGPKNVRTEGLWIKCDSCRGTIWKKDLEANLMVCTECGFHFKVDAEARLAMLADDRNWVSFDDDLRTTDALNFVDQRSYQERLAKAEQATGLKDAVICAEFKLNRRKVVVCVMEYRFIGGIERAATRRLPVIIVSASGGARMMEGALSLMQMAKISAALTKLGAVRMPYISVLTDPTTGGVTASYAMLGDLNIAEPGALIGFAGPRVIEQTIRQKLPKGFQRSEFLVEHGMLDAVVPRNKLKPFLHRALEFFCDSVE